MGQIFSILCTLIIAVSTTAQQAEEYFYSGNPYLKYSYCSFECDFKSTDKIIRASLDTSKNRYNHLGSSFNADSTYVIELSLLQKDNFSVIRNNFQFQGRYSVDNDGNIELMGDSPFDKNFLKMKEKKSFDQEIPCIYLRGYEFKLNDQFSVTYKGRLHTYCDGQESFCKD